MKTTTTTEDRRRAVIDKALAAPMNYDTGPNEARATWGEGAMAVGDPDWGNDTYTSAKDAVTNILHACMRMGLDPRELVEAAFCSFEEDNNPDEIGGGKPAVHDKRRFPSTRS